MSQTLTPWGTAAQVLDAGMTFLITEATVDGSDLLTELADDDAEIVLPDGLPTWTNLALTFVIRLAGVTIPADVTDLEAVVSLRCARTELRRRVELQRTEDVGETHWTGQVKLLRVDVLGAIELEAMLVGTVGDVRFAKLTDRRRRVVADHIDLDIPSRGGIDIRWRDFEDPDVKPPQLQRSAGNPSALRIEGDCPVLYLNSGLGSLKIVLARKGPGKTVRAARTMYFVGLAEQTRRQLLSRAFQELRKENDQVTGPSQRWAELLLAETARALEDWSVDEFRERAYDLFHADDESGPAALVDWSEFTGRVDDAVMRTTQAGSKIRKASEQLRDA